MPKRKAESKLSALVTDVDDDDLGAASRVDELDDNASIEPPPKRQKGRPKAATSKPVAEKPVRKTRSKAVVGPKKRRAAPGRGKASQAIEEHAEVDDAEDIEEGENGGLEGEEENQGESEDELDSPQTTQPQESRVTGRTRRGGAKQAGTVRDGEFEYTPTNAAKTRNTRTRAKTGNQAPEIAVERPSPAAEETPEVVRNLIEKLASADRTESRTTPSANRWMSPSKRPLSTADRLPPISGMKSLGSPSKSAQKVDGEVALRRKLGEMTTKYESMEGKYRALREIGIVEANSNLEKIRKQHEETTAASKQLISSLKSELSKQTNVSKQTRDLQQQFESRNVEVQRLREQLEEMKTGLAKAQTEAKSLQTKLTAARNATATAEKAAAAAATAARGPGVRTGVASRDAVAGALETAQVAQLKEDLYSDLTGLIIRDVKKRESDHLYDCIQTGLNGTLHFKLGVSHNMDRSTASLEAAQFHYIPLLDENRDRELLELLPDYLSVDITFSRQHAAMFYSRVVDRLTKKQAEE